MIVVPTDTPGFSVGRTIEKMGNRSSDTAELVFDDVRVPVSNTIGEPGRGFQQQMTQFQDERLIGSYMAVMGARRALDRTIEYLQMREAFGKPLLANQYLQYRLAELVADVDLLQDYCHDAAAPVRRRARTSPARPRSPSSRPAGSPARSPTPAVQYHGGMGYAEEIWLARYFRDARLISIGGGADEVMLRVSVRARGHGPAVTRPTPTADPAASGTRPPDGVATITLEPAPGAQRASTPSPCSCCASAWPTAAADDAVRVVVLTGTGHTFCAGADLAGARGDAGGFAAAARRPWWPCSRRCWTTPSPRRPGAGPRGRRRQRTGRRVRPRGGRRARRGSRSPRSASGSPRRSSPWCAWRGCTRATPRELLLTGERVGAERVRAAGLVNAVVRRRCARRRRSRRTSTSCCSAARRRSPRTKELLRRVPAMTARRGVRVDRGAVRRAVRQRRGRRGDDRLLQRRRRLGPASLTSASGASGRRTGGPGGRWNAWGARRVTLDAHCSAMPWHRMCRGCCFLGACRLRATESMSSGRVSGARRADVARGLRPGLQEPEGRP